MHSKKHKSQMSIIEFQKKYDTEDKCREELFKMRYPKGFKCSKCECTEYYYLKSRGKYQCKNCKVRKCCKEKHVSLCAECKEFPCKKVEENIPEGSEQRYRLEEMHEACKNLLK